MKPYEKEIISHWFGVGAILMDVHTSNTFEAALARLNMIQNMMNTVLYKETLEYLLGIAKEIVTIASDPILEFK